MSPAFIGRQTQLEKIEDRIRKSSDPYMISIHGTGGVGKTYLLRKIQEDSLAIEGCLCFPTVDFSQIMTRTIQWLMDYIAEKAPIDFKEYNKVVKVFHNRGNTENVRAISQEDVKEAFLNDFYKLESLQRCLFLFDTFELVQDTLLCTFILELAKATKNSVFVLAGRRNEALEPRLKALFKASHLDFVPLGNFDHCDGIRYISSHPSGVNLTEQEQEALYLLADNGLPIKMALALDWLSRGLLMQTIADYPLDKLNGMKAEKLQEVRLEFERELVTLVGKLGTHVDQAIYIMAHVNRRFNRELLELLIPNVVVDDLINELRKLPFVKFIENDYFVLHDELQRMVMKNVWQWSDQSHETRREISHKVIGYYGSKIKELDDRGLDDTSRYEQYILEIEKLYYQLDIDLIEGYRRFTEIFEETEEGRNIELSALALDTLLSDRSLPGRLDAFVHTFYFGWVQIRRQANQQVCNEIAAGIEALQAQKNASGLSPELHDFITQQVDMRTGEIYTLLGYTNRLLGNWPMAIAQYEKARCQQEELINDHLAKGLPITDLSIRHAISHLAENLNDIANLQRMTGDLNAARLYCKTSLMIRQSLGELRAQGHCHYVMSMIMWESGNTNEAMASLKKAREFYQLTGFVNLERAWLDRYEAFIMYRTGNLTRALQLFERAMEITSTNPGLQDEHAEILLFLSRISLDRDHGGDTKEALDKARQALNLATKVGNNYRITEAYITLCRCLVTRRKLGIDWQEGSYQEYFQAGLALAQKNHYNRLESLFAELMANESFETHNYNNAFKHYTIACQKATQFKSAVFERTLSKLGERLDSLLLTDPDRAIEMSGLILQQWSGNAEMQDANPCLVDEVNYIKHMAEGMIERRRLTQAFYNEHRAGSWKKAEKICTQLDALPVYEGLHQGQVWYQRAIVSHSANNFSYARMYCERAVRIQKANRGKPQELGKSYLLLSQIYWKLGNTAESAQYLSHARDCFQEAEWKLGLILVDLEQAYIYFRTYQYEKSRILLDQVYQALQELDTNADVYLAETLNLMARLTRTDPQSADYYDVAYQEAERRGLRALDTLQDKDWYASAEIHLTMCYLYFQWYKNLVLDGKKKDAVHYLDLAKKFNRAGWKRIQNVQSPTLTSVFHGIEANLYDAEGLENEARESLFNELFYATRTKHMRLLRAIDLAEDWLVAKPEAKTKEHAEWLAKKWEQEGLVEKYAQVSDSMNWFKTHRSYIIK